MSCAKADRAFVGFKLVVPGDELYFDVVVDDHEEAALVEVQLRFRRRLQPELLQQLGQAVVVVGIMVFPL